jgi:hypothetical protein
MMTANKTSGLGDNAYVGGYNISGDVQLLSKIGGGPALLNLTDITQSAYQRVGGLLSGELNFTVFHDVQTGQEHAVLSPLPRASAIVTYAHQPGTIGSDAASILAKQIGYDPQRAADGMLTIAVASQNSDGYPLEWGNLITAGVRTDTTATNGTALDGAASTSFGLSAYLHVFGVTGTSVTVKLQDSADNSTFADITGAAFAASTGRDYQRLETGATATVRRYVRAVTTGTFTNAQFVVNFVRRQSLVAY